MRTDSETGIRLLTWAMQQESGNAKGLETQKREIALGILRVGVNSPAPDEGLEAAAAAGPGRGPREGQPCSKATASPK
jgi:hypothetical protein